MLADASHTIPDDDEERLADALEEWMMDPASGGWDLHYSLGFINAESQMAFVADEQDRVLVLRTRPGRATSWSAAGLEFPVLSFEMGLNMIVDMFGLPSRFSTHSQAVLYELAVICEATAGKLEKVAQGASEANESKWADGFAAGLRTAGQKARAGVDNPDMDLKL